MTTDDDLIDSWDDYSGCDCEPEFQIGEWLWRASRTPQVARNHRLSQLSLLTDGAA